MQETSPQTETLNTAARPRGPRGATVLERGSVVDRYVVLDLLGRGGMGEVYRAYDPELDRRLAIKVVTERAAGGQAQGRLLQEARALARLQHSNVISIFDVGATTGGVFLAMEYVAGRTVERWLAEEKPTWRRVVAVFTQVAAGLAAAHAEGLVHRDVKPSNLMVADDGRVLVVDFGLAHETTGEEGRSLDVDALALDALPPGRAEGSPQGEGVAGTPRYMAPEQLRGESGPASDQFSFCVSLYQALYGELPFDRPREEGSRSTPSPPSWTVKPPPAERTIPGWLRAALLTGLAADPEKRFPSMDSLIEVLQRKPAGRRRWLVAGGGAAALLAVGVTGWMSPRADPCAGGAERFAAVWGEDARRRLEPLFLDSAEPGGEALWETATSVFDAYGEAWSEMHRQSCRATREGRQTAEMLDLRSDCLEQRLRELGASLELLAAAPARDRGRAADLIHGLEPVAACADTRALRAPLAPPRDGPGRRRLEALQERQAKLHALLVAGDYPAAEAAAQTLLGDAEELAFWPFTAEVLWQLGVSQDALSNAAAETTLGRAVQAAMAAGHDRVAAQAFSRLVRVASLYAQDDAASRRYAEQAQRVLERLSVPELLAAELADHRGAAARQAGRYDDAERFHRRSLELSRARLGEDHPSVAKTHLRLGNLYDELGRGAEAKEHFERALSSFETHLGPAHPLVADALTQLGGLARGSGAWGEAERAHRRALEIRQAALPTGRRPVAETLTYLGELAALDGRLNEARRTFAQALALMEEIFGPDHGQVATVLATMANAWTEAGCDEEAVEPLGRALQISESTLGAEHPRIGLLLFNLGSVHLRLEQHRQAEEAYARTEEIWARALGEDHVLMADVLTGRADALLGLDRPAAALPLLERAMSIERPADHNPKSIAETEFVLARTLRLLGREDSRARELALSARRRYLEQEKSSRRELASLEAWLQG